MTSKKEKVVTTTTEKVSSNGEKTVTTVTTTRTITTSNDSEKKSWWSKLSTLLKALIIAGSVILLGVIIGFILFGRVRSEFNTMESTIAKGNTVFFNRFATPQRGDIVAFHHPEADSIVPSAKDKNYYKMRRMFGSNWCNPSEVEIQGKKKRPIVLSRCYGEPGDIVSIKDNQIYVNDNLVADPETAKYTSIMITNDILTPSILDSIGLSKSDINGEEDYPEVYLGFYRNQFPQGSKNAIYSLTKESAENLGKSSVVTNIIRVSLPKEHFEPTVFPYLEKYHWNSSNFGPLVIPAKGKVIKFDNLKTLELYRRCIETYENNVVEVKGNTVYINGKEVTSYRFRRNYYFVVSDNRSSKEDSRYFGFLPDNHVKGVVKN